MFPKPKELFLVRDKATLLQITYEAVGSVQTTFLRLLSESARQNFTYTCMNSATTLNPGNAKDSNSTSALKFLGDNGHTYTVGTAEITILRDGCKVSLHGLPRERKFQISIHRSAKTTPTHGRQSFSHLQFELNRQLANKIASFNQYFLLENCIEVH